MLWLDCHDLESALASLAAVVGETSVELGWALREYDEARFEEVREDPWKLMPCDVLARFSTDVETVVGRFDGGYYFHGTRAVDPDAFRRRGILPLNRMVEEIWSTLRELAGDETSDEDWLTFRRSVEADGGGGHDGFLYRLKTGDRVHFGPYGLVVRETFFEPRLASSHDYLGCPEIVQDIARCFASAHAVNLEARFCAAAKPSIVKFRSTQLRPGAVNAALWYAYSELRGGEISANSNYSFDGKGEAVAPEDVAAIEIVSI